MNNSSFNYITSCVLSKACRSEWAGGCTFLGINFDFNLLYYLMRTC